MILGICLGAYFVTGFISTAILGGLAVLGDRLDLLLLILSTCWFSWPIWLLLVWMNKV